MFNIIPLFATPLYFAESGIKDFSEELKYLSSAPFDSNERVFLSKSRRILDELERCKEVCTKHLKLFAENVFCCEQDFYITNSWIAKTPTGKGHHHHKHINSIISGVLYLQADDGSSDIKFQKYPPSIREDYDFDYHIKEYNMYNSEVWSIPVKTGDILLFPSSLCHEVSENKINSERVILGFNTFTKGIFGKNAYCSDLNL